MKIYEKTVRIEVMESVTDAALEDAVEALESVDLKLLFQTKMDEIADAEGEAFRNCRVLVIDG